MVALETRAYNAKLWIPIEQAKFLLRRREKQDSPMLSLKEAHSRDLEPGLA